MKLTTGNLITGKKQMSRESGEKRLPAKSLRTGLAAVDAVVSPWNSPKDRTIERDIKREAVLKVSAQLFNEFGYHATSLAMIAERLQVTKPTLYYYIQNKEEILFECHRLGVELLRKAVAGVSEGQVRPAERLRATMLAYASVLMDDFCRCLIRVGEEALPLANRKELGRLKLALDREFRSIVQSGLDDASFEPCDPKIAAFTLAGALNWMGRWFDASGTLSKEEVALRTTDVLLNGLLRRTKQPQEIPLPRRRKVGKGKPVGG